MMLRFFAVVFVLLFFVGLFSGCEQCNSKMKAKSRITQNSCIYGNQNYSELVLDSCLVRRYISERAFLSEFEESILAFYERRNFQAAWFVDNRLSNSALSFRNILSEYSQSFNDTTLPLQKINEMIGFSETKSSFFKSHIKEKNWLELLLTSTFFVYSKKSYSGTDKNIKDLEWFIPRKKKNYEILLDTLVASPASFEQYEPVNPFYKQLKKALSEYRSIENRGGFPGVVMNEESLKTGDSSLTVLSLKKYLRATRDFTLNDSSQFFTDPLRIALIRFQKRFGLKETGVLDRQTLSEINVPVHNRIGQIMLNMERMRWMPDSVPDNYIIVNIPEFKLHVFENKKYLWSSNVVVGKAANATTIFSGTLSTVVFSPYWVVPQSIIMNEIIPAVRKNTNYLNNKQMEVVRGGAVVSSSSISWWKYKSDFPFVIRQRPGKSNALGLVKFLFPNSYFIYMHDTPSKNLFQEDERAFSHGCIRVAEVVKLANYVFSYDSTMTSDQTAQLLACL